MIKTKTNKGTSRTTLKKYAFVLSSAVALIGRAAADTLASFGFDSYSVASTGMLSGALAPDSGTGTAFGSHASSSTAYSFPAGNGSAKSFSSNTWAVGDYFQFQVNASTYMGLAVSFDMARSGTGVPTFSLQYSTDGTNFLTFTTFSVYATPTTNSTGGTGVPTFATGSSNAAFNLTYDLSSVSALNNNAVDYFRIAAATSAGAAGTDRVDNFVVTGTNVPEPSTLALFSAAGIGAAIAARRRKKA